MRASIDQPIAVRRPTTQIPTLLAHLSPHRPVTGSQHLTPRLGAEQAHQRLMRHVVHIEPAVDLWKPELHAKPVEHRHQLLQLITVECSLELPHDDRVEPTVRIRHRMEQRRSLRILTEHARSTKHARSSEGACTFVPPDEGALAGRERQI
ncbi:MAG: hypothetical protein WBA97_05105 [Actinophytocola sp.]